jgi:hypothetical protein
VAQTVSWLETRASCTEKLQIAPWLCESSAVSASLFAKSLEIVGSDIGVCSLLFLMNHR